MKSGVQVSVAMEQMLIQGAGIQLSSYRSFDAQFLQDHVIGGEVSCFAERSTTKIQVVGIGQPFHQAKLRCEAKLLFGLLHRSEEMLVPEGESLLLAKVEVLRVVVHNLRLRKATSLSTCFGNTVKSDILGTTDVVNLAVSLLVFQHLHECRSQVLDMTELSDLHARVGHGDGAAFLEALEEPLLHRVVVERPINVYWPDGGPRRSLALQQSLRVQLSFVSALGIHCIHLKVWELIRFQVNSC
jgi:hypothetical protein